MCISIVNLDGIWFSDRMCAVSDRYPMPDIFAPRCKILDLIGCLADHCMTHVLCIKALYQFIVWKMLYNGCRVIIWAPCTHVRDPFISSKGENNWTLTSQMTNISSSYVRHGLLICKYLGERWQRPNILTYDDDYICWFFCIRNCKWRVYGPSLLIIILMSKSSLYSSTTIKIKSIQTSIE